MKLVNSDLQKQIILALFAQQGSTIIEITQRINPDKLSRFQDGLGYDRTSCDDSFRVSLIHALSLLKKRGLVSFVTWGYDLERPISYRKDTKKYSLTAAGSQLVSEIILEIQDLNAKLFPFKKLIKESPALSAEEWWVRKNRVAPDFIIGLMNQLALDRTSRERIFRGSWHDVFAWESKTSDFQLSPMQDYYDKEFEQKEKQFWGEN